MNRQPWIMREALYLDVDTARAVIIGLREGWTVLRARNGWRPPADVAALLPALEAFVRRHADDRSEPDRTVEYITAATASDRAGVSHTTVRDWWQDGKVAGAVVNGTLLVDPDDIDDQIERRAIVRSAATLCNPLQPDDSSDIG